MAQDLEQYQSLIEQLKPVVNEPDFNQILSQVAADLSKPRRFLLKMELKRLAKPCKRQIDLRGSVDGDCRLYAYEGIDHYLDDVAIDVFERQIRAFGGYTLGVFEAVSNTENNFRVMHQKAQEERIKDRDQQQPESDELDISRAFQCKMIRFSGIIQRKEERMNFAVSIELTTELGEVLAGTTVDLSVNGLKIKLHKSRLFKNGERLTVRFVGLENEYALDKITQIPFAVVRIDDSREDPRISLQRLHDQPTHAFDAFLERFIHGNKRRYKVNLDNTIEAIVNKGYEQYYLPNIRSVPIYLTRDENGLVPRYLLTNDCNKDTVYYWADESNHLRIGYLVNESRLAQLLDAPEEQRYTYIYAFTHTKEGRSYFYSASADELANLPDLKAAFLGFGARKASWRVYKLQLTDMVPSQCHAPLSLPDELGENIKRFNQPPAPRLMARLKGLSHIALLTDVTSDEGTRSYQAWRVNRNMLTKLKRFAHPKNRPPPDVAMYRFRYQNLRKENRYSLRTSIIVSQGDWDIEGITEDVSTHGLRLELEKLFPLEAGATIRVNLPKLQALTDKYELVDLVYQVVFVSPERNVIGLQTTNHNRSQIAQQFFQELLRHNRSKLKTRDTEEDPPGIGEALRNIYAANVLNLAFFLRKEGVHLEPEAMLLPARRHPLMPVFSFMAQPEHLNLFALYAATGKFKRHLQAELKNKRPTDAPLQTELFVRFDSSQSALDKALVCAFSEQFDSDDERRQFVKKALGAGRFFAMTLFLCRTGRPDTDLLRTELNYVSTYATHKSKALEEQLWNITGVGDIIDITEVVMERLGFGGDHIRVNTER